MSLTVADCLKLPSLQDAKVIAGQNGLGKIVTSVSVLEYARVFAMADALFLGNELIITAFTSVMDDVNAQCNAIRRLNEVGEAAVILYYVGYYVKTVDPRLIAVADELDFPLIIMPPNTYNLRYNEVITEVLEQLFEERKQTERFVPLLLEQISSMPGRQRNASGVLRILSDHLRCSFLILDRDGRELGLATWPMSLSQELVDQFRDCADDFGRSPPRVSYHGNSYEIREVRASTKHKKLLRLYAMGEVGVLSGNHLEQAGEVLEAAYNLWRENLEKEDSDDLIRMVLNGQNQDIHRIASRMRVDLHALRIMWAILSKPAFQMEDTVLFRQKQQVKDYLRSNRKTAVVDAFDHGVVAFLEDAKYPGIDGELAQDFMADFSRAYPHTVLIWCGGLDSILDTRNAYLLIDQYFSTACDIYPHRNIVTQQDLLFAETCYRAIHGDAAQLERYLAVLAPINSQKDSAEMLKTIAAYLIDSDKSTSRASELLHVHESTVKYRLHKISRCFGYDITQMPAAYHLYLALAIRRLQERQIDPYVP